LPFWFETLARSHEAPEKAMRCKALPAAEGSSKAQSRRAWRPKLAIRSNESATRDLTAIRLETATKLSACDSLTSTGSTPSCDQSRASSHSPTPSGNSLWLCAASTRSSNSPTRVEPKTALTLEDVRATAASGDIRAARALQYVARLAETKQHSALCATLHRLATLQGRDQYIDPVSGFSVFTATTLRRRPSCCKLGCRHCPYLGDGAAAAAADW